MKEGMNCNAVMLSKKGSELVVCRTDGGVVGEISLEAYNDGRFAVLNNRFLIELGGKHVTLNQSKVCLMEDFVSFRLEKLNSRYNFKSLGLAYPFGDNLVTMENYNYNTGVVWCEMNGNTVGFCRIEDWLNPSGRHGKCNKISGVPDIFPFRTICDELDGEQFIEEYNCALSVGRYVEYVHNYAVIPIYMKDAVIVYNMDTHRIEWVNVFSERLDCDHAIFVRIMEIIERQKR